MQGILAELTGPSKIAVELRDRVVFKIVPMMNPDGVTEGNYRLTLTPKPDLLTLTLALTLPYVRSSLCGLDLNRNL